MITATSTTVTTTPTLLLSAAGGGVGKQQQVVVRNKSTLTAVHLGPSTVTPATGLLLDAGQSVTIQLAAVDKLHAVTASGTADVNVFTTTD